MYAYEGGALDTFREAKRLGIKTIYEQTSSYWYWARGLLTEEAERSPEFAGLLPNLSGFRQAFAVEGRRACVGRLCFCRPVSMFGRLWRMSSLKKKFALFTTELRQSGGGSGFQRDPGRPLQVLFVGLLVQHKGIGYLLDAIDRLGSQVQLTLVGKRFHANSRVDEACRRWRWFETLSHSQVLDVMMESDVLVLPSLGEGFGLVVTEALACGLPVIVTPNVGAGDLVCDGREGFVVPSLFRRCDRRAVAYSPPRPGIAALDVAQRAGNRGGEILGELSQPIMPIL